MVKIVNKDANECNVIQSYNDELREMVEYCNLPYSNCGDCNYHELCDSFYDVIVVFPFNYSVE